MPTRRQTILSTSLRVLIALAMLGAFGCVGRAWKQATTEDTPAAYYRFMRDHGDSEYVDAARERLEFHKLNRNPSLAGFERFRQKYPNSEFFEALQPALEKPAFEAAVAQGTSKAYRSFLDAFPMGADAARAEGNAVYVEAQGFGGIASDLGQFAAAYPESDFSAEAERTARAAVAHAGKPINRIGLVMDIAATTPEANRVRKALFDRIEELTRRVGIEIVRVPDVIDPADANRYPEARLEVTHHESEVESEMTNGAMERPAIRGVTQVVLREKKDGAIIAQREFELRVDDRAYVPGTSVLFSSVAPKFWDEFFVPTARWRNDQTVRPPIELGAAVVDVDAVGDRAIVLHENGDFELIGLADPLKPIRLVDYRHGRDLKRWSGVQFLGSRVAIYGEEGLELFRFTDTGPVAEKTWDRGEIGRVLSLATVGDEIVIGGAKGMQLIDPATGEIRSIMRRVIQGIDAKGEVIIFADGETVYISSLALLAENRVIAQMKLGRTFGPNNVRVRDSIAIVTGPGGALIIDVKNPQAPKALAKFSTREVGEIFDATRVRGRTFLIGVRGAQLLNRQLTRVEETIDVGERRRVAVMGRHLVMTNGTGLQVVDASPWADSSAPAASNPTTGADSLLNGSGF